MITQSKVLQLHCMFLVLSELLHVDMEKSSLLPSSQREGQTEYLGSPCCLSCCTGLLCAVQIEKRSAAAMTWHSRKSPPAIVEVWKSYPTGYDFELHINH